MAQGMTICDLMYRANDWTDTDITDADGDVRVMVFFEHDWIEQPRCQPKLEGATMIGLVVYDTRGDVAAVLTRDEARDRFGDGAVDGLELAEKERLT